VKLVAIARAPFSVPEIAPARRVRFSFAATAAAMKRLAPEIRLAALWEGAPRPFVDIASEAEAGIISPDFHLVTPEQVKAAHAAKLEVVPWTADSPEDWQKLIDAGVDAIITDDPAALIAYMKQRGLR